MRNCGCTSLSEFLGDQVVYRSLEPADPRLPGLSVLGPFLGISPERTPRKSEIDYARLMARLLSVAQSQRGITQPIRRLLFVGDTRLLDGTAFANLCQVGNWAGLAFIGSENAAPSRFEITPTPGGQALYLANRWAALAEFDRYASEHGIPVDEATAVILDIDKTLLGARGRNDRVIDRARLEAMESVIADLVGASFDRQGFYSVYQQLNQPEFHPFTVDNQDYLAYVCLMVSGGLYPWDELLAGLRQGRFVSFDQFMEDVETRQDELSPALADAHREVYARVKAGDPTPFKTFRRKEYLNTIQRFGCLDEAAAWQELLDQEIVITQEVRSAARNWKSKGALLFGLSDKPSEAATPTPALAAQGYQPIHRAVTHAVGESGDESQS